MASQPISFKNSTDIFGQGFSRLTSESCKIFSELLPHLDGTGNIISYSGKIKYIWAYIHYLGKQEQNHMHPILSKMFDPKDNDASAVNFVETVAEVLKKQDYNFTVDDLVRFVNILWENDKPPVVPYLNDMFNFVMTALKSQEPELAKAYENLKEKVEHVKSLTGELDKRFDGSVPVIRLERGANTNVENGKFRVVVE